MDRVIASQTISPFSPCALLCVLCIFSGCHLIFPFSAPAPGSDATSLSDGQQPADLKGALDQPDTATGDLLDMPAKDQSITTTFSCTPPKPVNEMKDKNNVELELTEVALRADGSALVARDEGSMKKYTATRSADDVTKFEPWTEWNISGFLVAAHEDYSFYLKGGKEHALVAKKIDSKREIWDCLFETTVQCNPLTLSFVSTPPFYFSSDRTGSWWIYRSVCTIQ